MKISDISVEYVDHCGTDLSIVNAARVSFAKESEWVEYHEVPETGAPILIYQSLSEADRRLINYLAKHKHYSPFNHTFLTVRIKAPIFVARQLVKHEYMPWNEVSRRYVDSEPEFYMPDLWRTKAENVKQGSAIAPVANEAGVCAGFYDLVDRCVAQYQWMLGQGVCPEQARIILPHNLMTEWVWSGTLKAFHKMLSLRLDPHTQYETRLVAERILPIVEEHFPVSVRALLETND